MQMDGARIVLILEVRQTKPHSYVNNYQLGLRFRAQVLRKFLFFELEPTFNYRVDEPMRQERVRGRSRLVSSSCYSTDWWGQTFP